MRGSKLCIVEKAEHIPHTYDPDFYPFRQMQALQALADVTKNPPSTNYFIHDPNPYSLSILSSELADVTKIPDKLTMMSYLSQLYDCFRREIPASTAAEAGANMESIPEEEQTLGQMVAKKAARKRRSR